MRRPVELEGERDKALYLILEHESEQVKLKEKVSPLKEKVDIFIGLTRICEY